MDALQVDLDLLRDFEQGLDTRHPERSRMPARVLGYGEISTVFEIEREETRGLALKRMALFHRPDEVDRYRELYEKYNRLLEEEIGLRLPPHSHVEFTSVSGRPVFYIIQQQLPASSIGSRAIHLIPRDALTTLVREILRDLRKVWDFNRRSNRLQIGIDGQISNWAIEGLEPGRPRITEPVSLVYLDTSTPLLRVEGIEQLDTELFLRSAPSFLVWVLRRFFLQGVVDRYYDFHLVAVDLAANFYKEQRPDLIPDVVRTVNEFFSGEASDLGVKPIEEQEVRSYYREDALIWSLYLSMRKIDRFIRLRLFRGEYPYILPNKIVR